MKKMIAIVVALILCVSALSAAVFAAAPGSMAIVGENIPGVGAWDKTTPRLIQFHTLKNAVNPPFLGGFSIFNTVVA